MSTRTHAALLALTVVATGAAAQPPAPPKPPPFSPYLNLLRGGTNPAVNYYGLVRPEQNLRQTLQGLQAATATNQQNISTLANADPAPTGVQTQFLNHYRYFQTQRSGTGANTGSAGTAAGSFGGGNRGNQLGGGTGGVPGLRR